MYAGVHPHTGPKGQKIVSRGGKAAGTALSGRPEQSSPYPGAITVDLSNGFIFSIYISRPIYPHLYTYIYIHIYICESIYSL